MGLIRAIVRRVALLAALMEFTHVCNWEPGGVGLVPSCRALGYPRSDPSRGVFRNNSPPHAISVLCVLPCAAVSAVSVRSGQRDRGPLTLQGFRAMRRSLGMCFLGIRRDRDSPPSKHAVRVMMRDLLLSVNQIYVPPSCCVRFKPAAIEQDESCVYDQQSYVTTGRSYGTPQGKY